MANIKELATALVNLTIKEANELVKLMKEEHGIETVQAGPVVVSGNVSGSGAKQVEEKSEFDVILKSAGASKLAVVKLVKEVSGLGLKEAKELVDGVPSTVKQGLPKIEAESMKVKLEEAGAEVELK